MIEMLVTASVILILGILLSTGIKQMRDKARQAACVSNLRQLGITLLTYAGEHGGKVPYTYDGENQVSWVTSLISEGYLTIPSPTATKPSSFRASIFCPGSDVLYNGVIDYRRGHYGLNERIAGERGTVNTPQIPLPSIVNPSKKILALDSGAYKVGPRQQTIPTGEFWYIPGLPSNKSVAWPDYNATDAVKGRHGEHINVLMVDGHIEAVEPSKFSGVESWEPNL